MRLLILGNGFDIAHGLSTKYSDFLEFAKWILGMNTPNKEAFERVEGYKSDAVMTEIKNLVKNNKWIDYFIKESYQGIGSNWVDFEQEIGIVVNCLIKGRQEYWEKASFENTPIENSSYVRDYLTEFDDRRKTQDRGRDGTFFELEKKRLLADLNRLTRALEIYLLYWVEQNEISEVNPSVIDANPDVVISFNYTKTHQKIYGAYKDNTEYCYIHGACRNMSTLDRCEMVLGMRDDDETNIYGVEFKKYYQRLIKTDVSEYRRILYRLEQTKKRGDRNQIYIFGHSLDTTDKEILEPILAGTNNTVIVYCFEKDGRTNQRELVANLISLLGKERTIAAFQTGRIQLRKQATNIVNTCPNARLEIVFNQLRNLKRYDLSDVNRIVVEFFQLISNPDFYFDDDLNYIIKALYYLRRYNLLTDKSENKLIDKAKSIIDRNRNASRLDVLEWSKRVTDDSRIKEYITKKIKEINEQITSRDIYHKGFTFNEFECWLGGFLVADNMQIDDYIAAVKRIGMECQTKNRFEYKPIFILVSKIKASKINLDEFLNKLEEIQVFEDGVMNDVYLAVVRNELISYDVKSEQYDY